MTLMVKTCLNLFLISAVHLQVMINLYFLLKTY